MTVEIKQIDKDVLDADSLLTQYVVEAFKEANPDLKGKALEAALEGLAKTSFGGTHMCEDANTGFKVPVSVEVKLVLGKK